MFELTVREKKQLDKNKKLWNYYNDDFVTDYGRKVVQLPMGRTLENTLVYDNWISKTVNRYASASIGQYASLEVADEDIQAMVSNWHVNIDFESKMTSLARYQGLYGYAVVKIIYNLDRDEDGAVIVDGKSAEDILSSINIAVFGGKDSLIRYDEYGNVDSILILLGDRLEAFYKDRLEIYESKNGNFKLVSTQPNTTGAPLAFVVKNLETGINTNSDVGGIITLQESLNDALTSLRLANHYHGFPIYTATGVEARYDDAGNAIPLVVGAGMTLQSPSTDAEFGRIEVPSIEPLKASVEAITKEIAVSTNSLSLLTGQIPSGTALGYMLTDFNSAVEEKQTKLRNFMLKLHKSIFSILDLIMGTSYAALEMKAYVSGYNPLQKELRFSQSKELYALGAISKRTLLDNAEVIDNTEDELQRLQEEAVAGDTSPLSLLRG